MLAPDDGHVTNVAVDPAGSATASAPACCWRWPARPSPAAAPALTLEVRVGNDGAQAAVPPLRLRAGRDAQALLRGHGEDAIVMWAHDIDEPAYVARLEPIEPAIAARRDGS